VIIVRRNLTRNKPENKGKAENTSSEDEDGKKQGKKIF
jgi:hypothetical protein